MPDYTAHKIINVDLHLTEGEAQWLQNYLQNFSGPAGITEGDEWQVIRRSLFNTLKDALAT